MFDVELNARRYVQAFARNLDCKRFLRFDRISQPPELGCELLRSIDLLEIAIFLSHSVANPAPLRRPLPARPLPLARRRISRRALDRKGPRLERMPPFLTPDPSTAARPSLFAI